jgi:hypothetical protein
VSEPAIYSRAAAALWRRVGDEVLVAYPGRPGVQRLSIPASIAWLLLEDPRTVDQLTEVLAAEWASPPDELVEHVKRLLDVLEEHGWVTQGVKVA